MQAKSLSKPTSRAFTLVEILVVLAIISILITISVVVAARVTQGGRVTATQDILRVLDTALTSYMADREAKVPAVYRDDAGEYFPLWDGRKDVNNEVDRDAYPAEPSLALFLHIASEVPAVDQTLKGIDSRFIKQLPDIRVFTPPGQPLRKNIGGTLTAVKGYTILDAWGRPIRFVHPAWDGGGGQYWDGNSLVARDPVAYDVNANGNAGEANELLRRSYRPFNPNTSTAANPVGDADEGICINGRPYFYSAGNDGDPGTRQDNVYSVRPTFPPETEKFQ